MDGLFDFLKTSATSSDVSGYIIAGAILIIGTLLAIGLNRFFGPIGEGTGHAIGAAGDAISAVGDGAGSLLKGAGSTLGAPGTIAQGIADRLRIDGEAQVETFDLVLTDGAGRSVQIKAHGPQTAPQMPQVMGGVPMLPAANPDVVRALNPPKKGKR